MGIMKRVMISIVRRLNFTFIVLIITFLFGNIVFASLAIEQSSKSVKNNLMNQIGGKMTITMNANNKDYVSNLNDIEYENEMSIFYELFNKLSNRDFVNYFDYNLHFSNIGIEGNYDLPKMSTNLDSSLFHGISNENIVDEIEKRIILSKGSKFTKSDVINGNNVILVSDQVKLNGKSLNVGDTISIYTYIDAFIDGELKHIKGKSIDFQIVGIFQPTQNKYSDVQSYIYPFYIPNQCMVNLYKEFLEIKENYEYSLDSKIWIYSNVINVDSPENLDLLIYAADVYKEKYEFQYETTNSYISQLIGPINSFEEISNFVSTSTFIVMTIILSLISLYFMKERKHEIGIYLSLGLQKLYILIQIICEILFVGLIGVILSIGSGKYIVENYSKYLLDVSISVTNEEYEKLTGINVIDPYNLQQNDILDKYEIIVTIEDISSLILLSTFTLVLSCIIPYIYICQLNPKKILLE